MRAFLTRCLPWLVLSLLLMTLTSCGRASRNDQGVSFTLFGWFDTPNGAAVSTLVIPISDFNAETTTEDGGNPVEPTPSNSGGTISGFAFAGMQNNIAGQTVRVDRMFHTFYIPGTASQPPDTSVNVGATLGPSPAATANGNPFNEGESSTLPGGLASLPSDAYPRVTIIPPAVRTWIFQNKEYLPEPPFTMVVTSYAEGVTSAGARVETNEVDLEIIITPHITILPPSGSAGSTGSTGSTGAS